MSWHPAYTLTPAIVRALMEIEAAKTVVAHTPLPPDAAAELRHRARLRSAHFSTRIEGNRLSLAEATHVIEQPRAAIAGRERDVSEVRNYWNALLWVEAQARQNVRFTETLIRKIHAIVERGTRAKPTPWRDGQNVIRNSSTGGIVYMPPQARDVPELMRDLVAWVNDAGREGLPTPVIAALAHYQFVTIHPYYDGNGRTARLLATFLLHRGSYSLNGFLALEEQHARDLQRYYDALATHPHHNYYEGRAEADLTAWVEYFVRLLAGVFEMVKKEALQASERGAQPGADALQALDHRARIIIGLLGRRERITSADVAEALGLSVRMARMLVAEWVKQGWLVVDDPSNRNRAYRLSASYRQLIGN
jgi:Fic family protein